MKHLSSDFVEKVEQAWGNPKQVAEIGINETFNHEDVFGFDHDDQVDNALRIGVIAGETAEKGSKDFIEAFTTLLNDE